MRLPSLWHEPADLCRWLRRFDHHDLSTLEERSHRPRNTRQPTWTATLAERVLVLGKQYPCWGKDKLVVLLAREKLLLSVSMVGRILSALKRRGALHEPPKPAVLLRQHRKLRKRPWAISKPNTGPSGIPAISSRSIPKKFMPAGSC
jgi:putative transposase